MERISDLILDLHENISTVRDTQSSLTIKTDKLEGGMAVLGEPYSSFFFFSNRSECSVRQNISGSPYLYRCSIKTNFNNKLDPRIKLFTV